MFTVLHPVPSPPGRAAPGGVGLWLHTMDSTLPTGVRFVKPWTCKVGCFRALFWDAHRHLRTVATDVHGECEILSDVTVEKWHKGREEWREIKYHERPSKTKGGRIYRVDLAVFAGLAEDRVYLHRLVFFVASERWPLTPKGWGKFTKEYPDKEIDHGKSWKIIDSGTLASTPWQDNRLKPATPSSARKEATIKRPPSDGKAKKREAPVDVAAAPAPRKSRRVSAGGGPPPPRARGRNVEKAPRLTITVNPDAPELDYGAPLLDAEERGYAPPLLAVVHDSHLAEEKVQGTFPWPHWPKRAAVKMREALDWLIDSLSRA